MSSNNNNNNNNNRDPADFSVRTQQHQSSSDQQQQPINFQIQLTDDEKRVLNECRKESLWYRSVPLMFASGTLLHLAMKRNLVSSYGYIAKQIFVLSSSYFAGSIMYAKECKKKALQQLPPDSNLVRLFNKQPILPSQNQIAETTQTTKPEGFTSYDDLRNRNRHSDVKSADFSGLQIPINQSDPLGGNDEPINFSKTKSKPQQQQQQPPPEQYTEKQRKVRKNQYGDLIYGDE